ncbi:MAG: RDD family protein [Acidimicrobiia bacterium]
MNENYYEVLGVDPGASRDELREAYRTKVDDLTAAREKKGVTDSQLASNRAQVASLRSAWNVLSDPFQRSRYDERVVNASDAVGGDDVEIVDDAGAGGEPQVQLTGWRKLMAPPPAKPTASGVKPGTGKDAPPPRGRREPTIVLPDGMQIAQPKTRGMALLFDLAVVLVILYAVQFIVPPMIQSDYKDIQSQVIEVDKASSAKGDINDAQAAITKAENNNKSGDLKDAQSDLKNAQSDLKSAQKSFNEKQANMDKPTVDWTPASVTQKQLDSLSISLTDDIKTTGYITALVTLVLALLYLVPVTAYTERTLGMRRRKIKVVRVDGSRIGWYPAFARFIIPLLIALAIPTIGPILGLGLVLWGYRDANGQGIHDKLARTIVVDA